MNYHIHITQTAERDMISAADYIEFTLKNPEAADHLLDTAEEKSMPFPSFRRNSHWSMTASFLPGGFVLPS